MLDNRIFRKMASPGVACLMLFAVQPVWAISIPPELQQQAERGDADAQFRLAQYFGQQPAIPENQQSAFRWMLAAARQGHARAQVNVARLYRSGQGTGKDPAEALKWFQRASKQDNAAGHFGLARMYYRGHAVPQDYPRAFELYERAAQAGHASAQAALGYMTENGLGVEADNVEALKWYLLSAEKWFMANNYVYHMRQKMDHAAIEEARGRAEQFKSANYPATESAEQ